VLSEKAIFLSENKPMNKFIIIALLGLVSWYGAAQTAVNFSANDCKGEPYDLYTELDNGKVVVVCWIMPCGSCILPAVTTYNVVQSFSESHPDKVVMYLCDDFADSNCATVNAWGNAHEMSNTIRFSDASIDMLDYGGYGMPKTVVFGSRDHKIYDTQIYTVDHNQLLAAINLAITESSSVNSAGVDAKLSLTPNPATTSSLLSFYLSEPTELRVGIFASQGNMVQKPQTYHLGAGNHEILLDTQTLKSGFYFIKLQSSSGTETIKLCIL